MLLLFDIVGLGGEESEKESVLCGLIASKSHIGDPSHGKGEVNIISTCEQLKFRKEWSCVYCEILPVPVLTLLLLIGLARRLFSFITEELIILLAGIADLLLQIYSVL